MLSLVELLLVKSKRRPILMVKRKIDIQYLRTWDSNKLNRRVYVKEEIILQEVEQVLATLHLEPYLHSEVIRLKKYTYSHAAALL